MQKFYFICLMLCSTLVFLLASILGVSRITFDFSIHEAPYDMVALSGLSESELTFAYTDTVHYLYDQRETLDTHINGTALFNTKEIKHMREVKNIFTFLIFLFGISLLTLILLLFGYQKYIQQHLRLRWRQRARSIYFLSVFVFFTLLGVVMLFFFEPLFITFHHLAFQNDDWLLNLSTDHLIQFLPEQFFFKRALQIALTFIILHIFSLIIFPRLYRKKRQQY